MIYKKKYYCNTENSRKFTKDLKAKRVVAEKDFILLYCKVYKKIYNNKAVIINFFIQSSRIGKISDETFIMRRDLHINVYLIFL